MRVRNYKMSKRKKRVVALVVALILLIGTLTGCTTAANSSTSSVPGTSASTSANSTSTSATTAAKVIEYSKTDLDSSWNAAASSKASLADGGIIVSGSGAKASSSKLEISTEGTYVINGTLLNGQIYVKAGNKAVVRIVLNGVNITNKTGPAIYVESAEKVIMILADGTNNTLTDGTTYSETTGENPPNGTIFSRDDLTINGTGALLVNGNYKKGIVSRDDLIIVSGKITITAKDDGINAHQSFRMKEADVLVTAGDDGIHADETLTIDGGKINIKKSYEGIESGAILINGGMLDVNSEDDGINAAGAKFTGGTVTVNAEGDGIDVNGSVYFTGSTVTVYGPTADNNGALDYDAECIITGGTQILVGSSGMAMAPNDTSKQNSILVYFKTTQKAGSMISIIDDGGKVIATVTPGKSFGSILFSNSAMKIGKTYSLMSGTKKLTDIKVSTSVTRISEDGTAVTAQMGGQGGHGGGPKGQNPPNGQIPNGQKPEGQAPPTAQ